MFKKLFLGFVIAMCGFVYSYAEENTCIIRGTDDNVEVFSCHLDNDNVVVSLSNDSNDIKVNVAVTVEVVYGNNSRTKSYTGKVMSAPGSTELRIPIESKVNGFTPTRVKVTSLSGVKCS